MLLVHLDQGGKRPVVALLSREHERVLAVGQFGGGRVGGGRGKMSRAGGERSKRGTRRVHEPAGDGGGSGREGSSHLSRGGRRRANSPPLALALETSGRLSRCEMLEVFP